LGTRTTRLTVIDDTPASLATADSVGAEGGAVGPGVLIGSMICIIWLAWSKW
jgi:hypothetical protein